MIDTPWLGDACSLVDAFRSGERSPVEELELVLAAVEASQINTVSFVDADGARRSAASADVTKPFGGVPVGVKMLEEVAGWPSTEASLVFKDRISDFTHGSDKIAFTAAAFAGFAGQPMGALDPAAFGFGTSATTDSQHVLYDSATGRVFYDADGQGGTSAVLIAVLTHAPVLDAGDILLM